MSPLGPLTAQIVGSYVKPAWLARPQRMRALDGSFWRPEPDVLQAAREDAARLAIYEQERAGLGIVTDGEAQRAAYDRHFLAALDGVDLGHTETVAPAAGPGGAPRAREGLEEYDAVGAIRPVVTGTVTWRAPAALAELRFLRAHATRPVKIAVIGAVSLACQLVDRHYGEPEALVMALAAALNRELRALDEAGADLLQIDEPMLHVRTDLAHAVGHAAIARMVEGLRAPVVVHVCYGYALVYRDKTASADYPALLRLLADCPIAGISLEYEQPRHEPELLRACGDKHVVLGLLDLGRQTAETEDHIAGRLRAALAVVPPERLHPASDCGMWYLPRALAWGKIRALGAATRQMRAELGLA